MFVYGFSIDIFCHIQFVKFVAVAYNPSEVFDKGSTFYFVATVDVNGLRCILNCSGPKFFGLLRCI